MTSDQPELRARLSELAEELEVAIDELRDLGRGIYPTVLANSGLAGTLRLLAASSARRVTFTEEHAGDFAPELEAPLYFCCLEAVQNATKHGGPGTHISIRLYADANELHLDVSDDGPGFDVAAAHDGVGLRNMRDRLAAVHGHLDIDSQAGGGTTVAAAVPITSSDRTSKTRSALHRAHHANGVIPKESAETHEKGVVPPLATWWRATLRDGCR